MRKTVTVCDVCGNNIAVVKCSLCKNDVCRDCSRIPYFYQPTSSSEFIKLNVSAFSSMNEAEKKVNICKKCASSIEETVRKAKAKIDNDTLVRILKYIRDELQSFVSAEEI